jgi:hypothetical protein
VLLVRIGFNADPDPAFLFLMTKNLKMYHWKKMIFFINAIY